MVRIRKTGLLLMVTYLNLPGLFLPASLPQEVEEAARSVISETLEAEAEEGHQPERVLAVRGFPLYQLGNLPIRKRIRKIDLDRRVSGGQILEDYALRIIIIIILSIHLQFTFLSSTFILTICSHFP
jgi:hypothetical protein